MRLHNIFAKSKQPQPDLTERARTMSDAEAQLYRYTSENADIDKVLAAKGPSLYAREMMADDAVKSSVAIKKLGVATGGWEVLPAVGEQEDGYSEAVEIADFVRYALTEMRGSMKRVLKNIAHAIVPGYSVQEINWKIYDSGPYAGMVGIDTIKPKPAHTFTFDMDKQGNILHLLQSIGSERDIPIPLEKVLLYTYDPDGHGLPQGLSDLRAAYRHYFRKDCMMRWSVVAAEKYAAPTPWGKYAPGLNKTQQNDLLNSLTKFMTETAIITPNSVEVELLQANGSVMAPYDASIEVSNKGIARAVFGQVLATGEGTDGSGSYAQAQVHRGILDMFLTDLRDEIAEEVLFEQLVKRLVDYNYVTEHYPIIQLPPADNRDLGVLGEIINKLLAGGVIHPEEPFIREEFGFPPMPAEVQEKIEQEKLKAEEQRQAELDVLRAKGSSSNDSKEVDGSEE
jgi:phage gp29-like protein